MYITLFIVGLNICSDVSCKDSDLPLTPYHYIFTAV